MTTKADFREMAAQIAQNRGDAANLPVIEKELVHYEIIGSLSRHGRLADVSFQQQ